MEHNGFTVQSKKEAQVNPLGAISTSRQRGNI